MHIRGREIRKLCLEHMKVRCHFGDLSEDGKVTEFYGKEVGSEIVVWIHLTQVRVRCLALVTTVMNLGGICVRLSSYQLIIIRTMLRGIS